MPTKRTDNKQAGRLNGCLSFLKQAAALALAIAALICIFTAGTMYALIAQDLSSEPVYEATPGQVNPALEGKLVKMRVTEIVADGGTLTDETFGLSMENTIALRRFFQPTKGRLQVSYGALHGIRKACFLAPVVKAGAYSLRARESFWGKLGGEYLNPDTLQLPSAWEENIVSRTKYAITLRTNDISNLATPHAVFRYERIASPWRGVLYMVGRQHGHELDITGDYCGLISGEEEFQQRTRLRPMTHEALHMLPALLGAITLCLLPVMLLVQKRGCLRALCAAALLGILLNALVAGTWLLLPHAEHNVLTWTYTLAPALVALVLLRCTCRNKH